MLFKNSNPRIKKAEISISIMIYILIGLIVLLIVIAIFVGKVGVWNKGTECIGQGGKCCSKCGDYTSLGKGNFGCEPMNYCCLGIEEGGSCPT